MEHAVLAAVKVAAIFFVIYFLVPVNAIKFDKTADGFLDKFFITLIVSSFFTIVIVYFLAFTKLYETFSFVPIYIAGILLLARLNRGRSASLVEIRASLIVFLLDLAEGKSVLSHKAQDARRAVLRRCRSIPGMLGGLVARPFAGVFPLAVLAGAAYLRYKTTVLNAAYTAPDSYVHLAHVKSLAGNQVFQGGIYPYGYHALLSAMNRIFFIDPYWLIRFMGPLGGLLMVLSIYYFAVRMTGSYRASLLALVLFGLVTSNSFPDQMWRQTAALPEEFATVFVLPGLYFLWLYLRDGGTRYLALFAAALAVTGLVHPYATAYLIIWSLVLLALAPACRATTLNRVVKGAAFLFLSGLFALVPLGVGVLEGGKIPLAPVQSVFSSVSQSGTPTGGLGAVLPHLFVGNVFLDLSLPVMLLLIASLLIDRSREWRALSLTVVSASLFTYLQMRAPDFHLPQLMVSFRTGIFLACLLAVLAAAGFRLLEILAPAFSSRSLALARGAALGTLCVAVCLATLHFFRPQAPTGGHLEYNAAAQNYLAIRRTFPVLDWTIVAPTEQLEQVLGYGWHFELLRFVQKFTLAEAADPAFQLPFPTDNILVYTEQRPLGYNGPATSALARENLKPEGSDPHYEYYVDPAERAVLEAKAIEWMDVFKEHHSGVSVFYRDADMTIYLIKQKVAPGQSLPGLNVGLNQ